MPQSYYKLFCHIVWGTKNREPIIDQKIENFLKQYIPLKIKELKQQQLALNMTNDHLHLLISFIPSISLSEFIGKIKGVSAHETNLRFPNNNFEWQRGYGILTLGQKAIPFVKKYIDSQKEHHKNKTTFPIMEYLSKID